MFGLEWSEILVAGLVGLLLFGGNLPKVAAEAARWMVGIRRSLNDLRRESGIEREFENAKREVEASVAQGARMREAQQKLTDTIARPFREVAHEVRGAVDTRPPPPSANPPPAPPPKSDAPPSDAPPAIEPLPPPPRPSGRDEAGG